MGDPGIMSEGSNSWTSVCASNTQLAARNKQHLHDLPEYDRSMVSMGRKIGEGGQGCIYEAKLHLPHSFKPVPVVLKKFKPFEGVSQGHFPREIFSMKSVNLCLPLGFFLEGDSLCMILKRFSCDLRVFIDSRWNALRDEEYRTNASPFTDEFGRFIILQLAMGVKALHEYGVYHGDLKAANILMNTLTTSTSERAHLAVADFERSEGVVGTGFFRAPEVLQSLRSRVPLSKEQWLLADVYSFGMVCYEVLTGRIPFEGHRLSDYDLVLNGGRPELPEHVPESLRDLVVRCWHADPHCRPSWDEILEVLPQHGDALVRHDDPPATFDFRRHASYVLSLESQSFESLIHESKHLIRDLTARHERDSKSFRSEFMPFYWASECVATAEEFASKFLVDSSLESPLVCSFQEIFERMKLLSLLRHQQMGSAFVHLSFSDQLDILDYSQEYIVSRERLQAMLVTMTQKLSQNFMRMEFTADFEVGASWPGKLLFFHALVKWVLWYEHAETGWERDFLMERLFPTHWSQESVTEALLTFFCMMGNAYMYVLFMITCEPVLLGLQYGLYKIKGSKNILYLSYGERICRFQRAWMKITRYEVVSIILSFSFIVVILVYGLKGILGWLLFPCMLIYSPYWRQSIHV